ncbi:hypothetical protein ACEUDE_05945 [Aeromonas veronii]
MSEQQRITDLLRDLHGYIGSSIPQTIFEHCRGCDLLDRIDAALTGPVVPDSWKWVPVEPTAEMKTAGIEVEVCDDGERYVDCLTWEEVEEIYRAMLAAAPKQQGGEPCATELPLSSPA